MLRVRLVSAPLQFPSNRVLRFGDFAIDLAVGELRKRGMPLRLRPQPLRILMLLASHPGELITREEIQREIWGEETFVDFERGLNSCMTQIRAVLNDDTESPRYIETLPRRGYRFIAPVEEITMAPAPPVRELEPPPLPSQGSQVRRPLRWLLICCAGLALALAILGIGVLWRHVRPAAPSRIRLAVLPFDNLSGDPGQDFFSDGFSEEMITELGQIAPERLGVIARTSASRYRNTQKTAAQIGKELGVDYLVEGSLRRDGDRVHLTAQLIQVKDQTSLWAHSYERVVADTLAIQSDLAQHIADSLAVRLLPAHETFAFRGSSTKPEAHDAYLKGRYELNKLQRQRFETATKFFQQAIDADPNYALAYTGLADSYSYRQLWGALSPQEAFPKARAAAQKALELDDSLAEAHNSMALVNLYFDWDFPAAEKRFQRAITLEPGFAVAYDWYAVLLSATARHDEAIAAIRRAEEIDPLSRLINVDNGWFFFYARRYDEAIRQCQRTLELYPKYGWAMECVMESFAGKGDYAEALKWNKELMALEGATPAEVDALDSRDPQAGWRDAAKWWKEHREKTRPPGIKYLAPYDAAVLDAMMGEKEHGLAELERAYGERDTSLVTLKTDPRLDPLRTNPRFQNLLQEIGLMP
jgi:TolB-like protein/DNA-binding winged helix-turn-helix (wHTH) protein/Tfp pilus assembly protein PilF